MISEDGLTYRYAIRPEAKFHDGTKITAHDAAFTLKLLKEKGHPIITQFLRDFAGAEAPDGADAGGDVCAQPRARCAAVRGRAADLSRALLHQQVVSTRRRLTCRSAADGYKVGRFEPGRFIEYERVKDWWGAELPVSRGQNNFDVLRFEYYRDRDVAFEGFTGKNYLFREEFTSRIWATRYDFPAIKDDRVKREVLPDNTPSGAQGWFLNTRLPKFKNPALREAFIYAFDFEWTNKTIMYGAYERTHSVFQNSDMMAIGKPCAGRACAARAVPRQGAGRGVRRAVRAAGVGRFGAGPRAAAQGEPASSAGRLRHQGRQAGDAEGRARSRSNS